MSAAVRGDAISNGPLLRKIPYVSGCLAMLGCRLGPVPFESKRARWELTVAPPEAAEDAGPSRLKRKRMD